ncbi:MAG: sulfite reductase, ferredoxin dependent, partial [Cyanobacteria bacterium P01_F01_bin.86]
RPFVERLKVDDLETGLEPLFVCFRDQRRTSESFGDFCDRVGFDLLRQFSDSYDPATYKPRKKDQRHRIGIYGETYELLRQASEREGRPMSQITADAIQAYVTQSTSGSEA